MNVLEQLNKAMEYIEANIDGYIDYQKLAQIACCSEYHFRRMFSFLSGMSLGEYIRNRRLTAAAYLLKEKDNKIIDVAMRYGYESPDAFAKAFQIMHGITPTQSKNTDVIKTFLPMTFQLNIRGGYNIMQKSPLITKKFMLVGFEAKIDLKEKHWFGMDSAKKTLRENLGKINNAAQPIKYYGLWMADPNVDYTKKENHSKRLYFHGIEVINFDNIPAEFTIKDFPECSYALFIETEHGSPKYEWLETIGYKINRDFQKQYVLDMEIYKTLNLDDDGNEWEVVIPIINQS